MTLPQENILFQLFGVANIFTKPDKTRKILNCLYRVYFLLILMYIPRGVIKLQYDVIQTGNIVLSTKVFIETVTYWLTLYVSYVHLLLRDDKISRVKSSIVEMADIFMISRAARRKQDIALWSVVLTVLLCQMTYYILGMLFFGSGIFAFVTYFLNKFTVNLITYQFVSLLWIIQYLFGELNKKLVLLKSGTGSPSLQQRELLTLKGYHATLTSITKALSEGFSLHIFFIVTNTVVETICSLNGLLFVQESCQGDPKCIYNESMNSILWFCNFNVPTIVMVFTCSSVKDEARKTQKLVLDIELESRDEAVISITENFSLELELNRFTFTGYGCFEVDKTMLLSNASTALTYLIIQKQFAFDGLYTSYTGF